MNTYVVNLAILAALIGANATNVSAEGESYDESWKSPLAKEFSDLDTTGNGFLLRNEAAKNNAMSNKMFTQADVNKDGAIDVDEYIYFKTGQWPTVEDRINAKANNVEYKAVSKIINSNQEHKKKLYI